MAQSPACSPRWPAEKCCCHSCGWPGLRVCFVCDSQCLLEGGSAVLAPLPSGQGPDLVARSVKHGGRPTEEGAGARLSEVSWTQVVMRAGGPASGQTPREMPSPSSQNSKIRPWQVSRGKPRTPTGHVAYGEKINSSLWWNWVSHILPGLGRMSSAMGGAGPSGAEPRAWG